MSQAAVAQQQLTVLEHLHELWLRLISSVVVAFIGGGVAYFFRLQIINFLQRPLHEKLYYTSPMGSFQFVMQVCLLVGVILALPMLIYNVLRFIEPAFEKQFSKGLLFGVLLSSLTLAALGVAFGYYLTLPFALRFFSSVGTSTLHPLISVNEYFSFILGYLATFAIVFQLPLLLLFINHITPFKPGGLTKWRKHVYVGSFAISLIMPSSPDPLSQVSLAIPIIALYELSILLTWKVNRNKYRHDRRIAQIKSEEELRVRRAASHPTLADDLDDMLPGEVMDTPIKMSAELRAADDSPVHGGRVLDIKRPSRAHVIQPVVRNNFQQPTGRKHAMPTQHRSLDGPRLISDIIQSR